MNASVGDVLNQGRFAIYVSNISEEGILLQGNNLWVPTGDARAACRSTRTWRPPWASSSAAGASARSSATSTTTASSTSTSSTATSPPRGGELLVRLLEGRRRQRARHLRREELAGHGRRAAWPATSRRRSGSTTAPGGFVDVAPMVGVTDRHDGRSVALADLGNRGALDVVVANQRGPLLLYRNEVAPGRDWIAFELEGGCRERRGLRAPAATAAPSAPRSTVHWNGQQQVQEVLGRLGLLRAEPAAAPLRSRARGGRSRGGRALAVGQDRGAGAARGESACTR